MFFKNISFVTLLSVVSLSSLSAFGQASLVGADDESFKADIQNIANQNIFCPTYKTGDLVAEKPYSIHMSSFNNDTKDFTYTFICTKNNNYWTINLNCSNKVGGYGLNYICNVSTDISNANADAYLAHEELDYSGVVFSLVDGPVSEDPHKKYNSSNIRDFLRKYYHRSFVIVLNSKIMD